MKKIMHLSYNDNYGAGSAVYMFHKSLEERGFFSRMLVLNKTRNDGSIIELDNNRFTQKCNKLIDIIEDKFKLFDMNYQFYDRMRYAIKSIISIEEKIGFKPDVVVIGWNSKFIDLKVLLEIKNKYNPKFYWMFTDMAPMTGGCHFKWDCEEFKNNCQICPAVAKLYSKIPHKNFEYKKDIIRKIGIDIVYLVPWVKDTIEQSSFFGKSKKFFYPASGIINEDIFVPMDKVFLRNKYHIPLDKKVVLYSAVNLTEKRKGFEHFIDSIRHYSESHSISDLLIITIGNESIDFENLGLSHIECIQFGIIKEIPILAEMINIADVCISPILEDMGPAMLLFYMLCGVPPIVYDVAIAKDVVKHLHSGYVAKMKDPLDIANGIDYILNLNANEYVAISKNCRDIVLSIFSKNIESEHMNLFIKEVLND